MQPLLEDIGKVRRTAPARLPYLRLSPGRKLSFEDARLNWAFAGPGAPPYDGGTGRVEDFYRHDLTDQDSWASLATKAGYADPRDLVRLNFETVVPEEVNWLLEKYVGCNRTRDTYNFSFSASAGPRPDRGFIWMPKKPATKWPPPRSYEPANCALVPMSMADVLKHRFNDSVLPLALGGQARVGMTFDSLEGKRRLLSVSPAMVVFLLTDPKPGFAQMAGKLYMQQGNFCADQQLDTGWGFGRIVKDNAAWFQTYSKAEIELLMGLVGGAGKWVSAGVMWAGLADFFLSDKKDKAYRMGEALYTTWQALSDLGAASPTLRDLLIRCFYERYKKELGTTNAGDTMMKLAGAMITEVGPEALDRRMSATALLAKSLEQVRATAKDVLKEKAGSNFQHALEEYKKDSAAVIKQYAAAGVMLNPEEAQRIVDEVAKHPDAIGTALDRIVKALDRAGV